MKVKEFVFKKIFSSILTKNYKTPGSCVTIGNRADVYGCYLDGKICIAERSKVVRADLRGNISIGKFSALNGPNLDMYAGKGTIEIGSYSSIARNVSFQVDSHNYNKLTTYLIFKNFFDEEVSNEILMPGNIVVGNDVWIGTHSVILGGVSIGNGAVIAANSVVNKDVPPFAIVAGSPASIIKFRFDMDRIKLIENSKWWDWDETKLRDVRDLFRLNIADTSIEELKALLS